MATISETSPSWTRNTTSDANAHEWIETWNSSDSDIMVPPSGITRSGLTMEQLQYMVRNLQIYLAPCVASIGLICNILGVFAISCRPMLKFSSSHYVIAILICDALQLAGVLQSWLNEFGWHLFFIGGWCQFSTFASEVAKFTSSWCFTALALDRLLCVRYPSAELKFCLPWVARVVIISIVIIATVVYLNISLLYAVIYIGKHAVCHVLLAYTSTMERLGYAGVFVNSFVPSLLIFSFAFITLCQLLYNRHIDANPAHMPNYSAYTRHRRRSLYATQPILSPEEDADLSQERLTLALLFSFIVLSLPYDAFMILDTVYSLKWSPTVVQRLHSYLISQILVHLKYVQFALDTAVITGCHKLIRRRFAEKYFCGRCAVRQDSGHELQFAHRVSYDDVSNDDSTIHIIRHEIQRPRATAL